MYHWGGGGVLILLNMELLKIFSVMLNSSLTQPLWVTGVFPLMQCALLNEQWS